MLLIGVFRVPATGVSVRLGAFGITWSGCLLSQLGPSKKIKSNSVMQFSGGRSGFRVGFETDVNSVFLHIQYVKTN